jgi:hypothetical protein
MADSVPCISPSLIETKIPEEGLAICRTYWCDEIMEPQEDSDSEYEPLKIKKKPVQQKKPGRPSKGKLGAKDRKAVCANCGVTTSPAWRRAKLPGNPLFCNACGIMCNDKKKIRKLST